jgi:hypothetical protein
MGNTKVYLVALCIMASTMVQSAARTGNEVRADCEVALRQAPLNILDGMKAGYCFGFVDGILFGKLLIDEYRFCPPDGVTTEQAA